MFLEYGFVQTINHVVVQPGDELPRHGHSPIRGAALRVPVPGPAEPRQGGQGQQGGSSPSCLPCFMHPQTGYVWKSLASTGQGYSATLRLWLVYFDFDQNQANRATRKHELPCSGVKLFPHPVS